MIKSYKIIKIESKQSMEQSVSISVTVDQPAGVTEDSKADIEDHANQDKAPAYKAARPPPID